MSKGLEELKEIELKWQYGVFRFIPNFDAIEKELKKYEQYKAIEEELGIDLITLFRALKKGAYLSEWQEPIEHYDVRYIDKYGVHFSSKYDFTDFIRYYTDYGKTWALTREELL